MQNYNHDAGELRGQSGRSFRDAVLRLGWKQNRAYWLWSRPVAHHP